MSKYYIKSSKGEKVFNIFNILMLIIGGLLAVYPLMYVLFASISDPVKLTSHTGLLLKPLGFSIEAYKLVLRNPMLFTSYGNTIFYVVAGTSVNLVLTLFAAYGLSRKNLFFKNTITLFILFTMFFQGGIIPLFLLVQSLSLTDTRWALILPVAVNTWNFIIMRTYMEATPVELEESAKIDGAGHFRILYYIFIPLSKPVISVIGLFYAVYHWNSWFHPMIFIRNRALYPLQIILREILIANDLGMMMQGVSELDAEPVGNTIKFALIMVATVPILMIYPFLQKNFVKGVMLGAVKG